MMHDSVIELAAAGDSFRDHFFVDTEHFCVIVTEAHGYTFQAGEPGEFRIFEKLRSSVHGKDYDLVSFFNTGFGYAHNVPKVFV